MYIPTDLFMLNPEGIYKLITEIFKVYYRLFDIRPTPEKQPTST